MSEKISFVVVNYKGKKYLPKCFDSIYAQTYPEQNIEIIMVDNNSKDGSVEFVKKKYPKIKIIQNKVNNYCIANNLGIKKAKGSLIFLLNNDAYLKKDCLNILVENIIKDNKTGAVTGKILFENGKIQSTGHIELPNFYFGDRGFMEKDTGQYNKKEYVESICFASVLIKKECIASVGLLDEEFIMYCEDVDFSIRVRKKGWKLLYIPEAVTYHKFRGTSYILNPEDHEKTEKKFVEVNRLLLLAKHYPEKLPHALSTSASFYINKEYGFIYDNLALIMKKLYENHPEKFFDILPRFFDELKKVISFEKNISSIESEINQKLIRKEKQLREKENAIQEFKNRIDRLKKDFKKKEAEISGLIKKTEKEQERKLEEREKEKARELKFKDIDIKSKKKEIKLLKRNQTNLIKKFKSRESKFLTAAEKIQGDFKEKESELINKIEKEKEEKEVIRNRLSDEIKKRDKIIFDFFSSKGYRLILEPLNAFYEFISRKKTKK